ncbi:MAG: 1-acyl-sn-glycerol-3-phosphate acyltransferase [Oscillospiraceae bacterium]|nr:1-acyl-sn-glycerol-3-phosphate acyltransferase [Oscillospiraceae bacterium]
MNPKESKRFYRVCYRVAGPVIRFFNPIKVFGDENKIQGAALVCANHSRAIDPFLIALAFGINTQIHVLAKIEVFRVPVLSYVLKKLGMISVDRGALDVASIKSSLSYLKKGEKVVIFPEGTRISEHDSTAAKSGAVKLAERAGVPIMPVFMPRKKAMFKKTAVIFGEPYLIEKKDTKRTPEDYAMLSEELMNKIQALEPKSL